MSLNCTRETEETRALWVKWVGKGNNNNGNGRIHIMSQRATALYSQTRKLVVVT